jgi:chromosome segregation ATPase
MKKGNTHQHTTLLTISYYSKHTFMKLSHIGLLLGLFMVLFSSCENYEEKYNALVEKNAADLKRLNELEEEDRLVRGDYSMAIETLNSIEDTLRSIATNEKEIQRLTQEKEFSGNLSQRQAIIAKLQALRDANEAAKEAARKMQSRVRSYQIENQELKKMIAQSEKRIDDKEEDLREAREIIDDMELALAKMEGQLSEKSGQLADAYRDLEKRNEELTETNIKLKSTISDLKVKTDFIEEQAKAYVACGDKRVLRKAGILSKTSMKKLAKNYLGSVQENGDEIDYFNNDQIDCGGDGVITYVLPERDVNSYEINGSVLLIKNSKTFWATDKTVVLVKK